MILVMRGSSRVRYRPAGLAISLLLCLAAGAKAEDGYRLWLRYDVLPAPKVKEYRRRVAYLLIPGDSDTINAIRRELTEACSGLLGMPVAPTDRADRDGALIVGTPRSSALIAGLKWQRQLDALGRE